MPDTTTNCYGEGRRGNSALIARTLQIALGCCHRSNYLPTMRVNSKLRKIVPNTVIVKRYSISLTHDNCHSNIHRRNVICDKPCHCRSLLLQLISIPIRTQARAYNCVSHYRYCFALTIAIQSRPIHISP